MTYQRDAGFLQALILGQENLLAPGALARIVVMHARYRAARDAGMVYLVRRAMEAHTIALARASVAADRAYLKSLLDGTQDPLSENTFPRMEPMFAKYTEGSEMFKLLEQAAQVFGDAVQEVAAWALAGVAIDEARRNEDDE